MPRWIAVLIAAGLLALGAVVFYHGSRPADPCAIAGVTDSLVKLLPRDTDRDGVFLANPHLASGQRRAFPYRCEAKTAFIRTDVNLSKTWRTVSYSVAKVGGHWQVSLLPPDANHLNESEN